jgi:hypothetical protein
MIRFWSGGDELGRPHLSWRHRPGCGTDHHDRGVQRRARRRRQHGAWAAPSWREAALEYHKARDGRVSIVPYAPEHLARLRRLLDDDISLDRAWHELNGRPSKATAATVEALVFGLRNGLAALPKNPDRLRRLSELNAEQLKAVCRRVQNFNPEIATPWSSDEVAALITKWRELHARL